MRFVEARYGLKNSELGRHASAQALVHSPSYKLAYGLLASSSMTVFLSALYLMKSACGIDIMAGPSPLHHIFF